MIVVDTSALMAIVQRETEAFAFQEAIIAAGQAIIAAPTVLELFLAAHNKVGDAASAEAQILLDSGWFSIVDWTERLLPAARRALSVYGKGRHPARLNFGDCMVYALARDLNLPLLYKGDDFAQTDIRSALS